MEIISGGLCHPDVDHIDVGTPTAEPLNQRRHFDKKLVESLESLGGCGP